jgi:hypothetical protein
MIRSLAARPRAALAVTMLGLVLTPTIAPARPALTIYSRDLGHVRDTRTLELAGPRDTVRIADVPERLDFSSVRLEPAGSARVTRLAWRWDVASGDGLLESSRGRRVRVVSREDRVAEGTLVAVDGAWLVVRTDDGHLVNLSRMAVDEVRLATPAGRLSQRPTLEAAIEGGRRGPLEMSMAYLTGGLSWNAEHVLVRRGETAGSWSAQVTIENTTGLDFVDADVKLIAGEPRRVSPPPAAPYARDLMMVEASAVGKAAGNAVDFAEQTFSEYHLYALDRPATVRDRETQSLTMIAPTAVTFRPRYEVRPHEPHAVAAVLEFENTNGEGPAVPLPAGRVRVYEADASGALQFAGESRIGHIPVGDEFKVEVGRAFDLTSERRVVEQKRISDRENQTTFEVEVRNRRDKDVVVYVQDRIGGEIEVIQKTHEFKRVDANTLEFTVPVAAGKEATVRWTVRQRY